MEAHGFTAYDMIVRGASVYDTAYLEAYGACARQGVVAYPINGGTSEIMRDIIATAVLP